ncbi:mCG146940 [Mus musculus]|nr:mCG146940 [Mus musculus]
MFCFHVWLFVTCVPGPFGGQQNASDSLEQELKEAVSHCVLGIKTGSSVRADCTLNH